jgi:hypothetical protein
MFLRIVRWYFKTKNPAKYILVPIWLWIELLQIPYEVSGKKGRKILDFVYGVFHGFLFWFVLYLIVNFITGWRLQQLLTLQ